jgi:hypothetical protein
MHLTDSLTEGNAKQTWYECPTCAATQTISRPYESSLRRIGNSLRCSTAWPDQPRLIGT